MEPPTPILSTKDTLDYAKSCLDRFVEVYKARLTLWTFFTLGVLTLMGFGIQNRQPMMFVVAGVIPFGLLLLDLFVKRHYAAPFLYAALKAEYSILGKDSGALLFAAANSTKQDALFRALTATTEEERQREFRSTYVGGGGLRKLFACSVMTATEALLWLAYQ